MKPLSQLRNQIVAITDDTEAQTLLLQIGAIDKFPASPNSRGPWAARVGYGGHPTHWIMATRFSGFPRSIDNGYLIECLPKSRFTLADANRWLRAQNQLLFPEGPILESRTRIRHSQN